MRPTEMMKAFGRHDIELVARQVEDVLFRIMQDAAG
jgi:hypothetical protein